jgi:hypothetical protein
VSVLIVQFVSSLKDVPEARLEFHHGKVRSSRYIQVMGLADVQRDALALNESDRARLVAFLLETLQSDVDVSDEEVLKREAEMHSGQVQPISHEEFLRLVERDRGIST